MAGGGRLTVGESWGVSSPMIRALDDGEWVLLLLNDFDVSGVEQGKV